MEHTKKLAEKKIGFYGDDIFGSVMSLTFFDWLLLLLESIPITNELFNLNQSFDELTK